VDQDKIVSLQKFKKYLIEKEAT